jgi:hypothetical protein
MWYTMLTTWPRCNHQNESGRARWVGRHMKRIVSISLGSSRRDYQSVTTVLGQRVAIERVGTDGDVGRARALIRAYDGRVDAISLDGPTPVFRVGPARYPQRAALRTAAAATHTPVLAGALMKSVLDRIAVERASQALRGGFGGRRALLFSGAERYALARALVRQGARLRCADPLIHGGAPFARPARSLAQLERYAAIVLPLVALLPTSRRHWRSLADGHDPRAARLCAWADLLAGEFARVQRFAPHDLSGKLIVADDISLEEIRDLRRRGATGLVTLSPNLGGARPYVAASVLEAIAVSILECGPEPPVAEIDGFVKAAGWAPDVLRLDGTPVRGYA